MNDSTKIKLNDQIAETIMSVVKTSLVKADYISAIEQKLRNEVKAEVDEANARTAFIDSFIADIALMYGIRYQPGLPFDHMVDELDIFKKHLIKSIKSGNKPKHKYLQFTVNEDGDINQSTVKTKDMLYVRCAFGSHRYEDGLPLREVAFNSDEHMIISRPLYRRLCMATGWSYEQITDWNSGISEKQLMDAIIQVFVSMVSDDSVSVIEFSECLHDIVVTDDGCSCDWLVI